MSSEAGPDDVPDPRDGPAAAVRWFFRTNNTTVVFVRDAVSSALAVAAVGLLLFAVSGVWPPMVAVESGSMEPHMNRGDLVVIVEEERFAPEIAEEGIVTYETGERTDYRSFGSYGNVIVYAPPDRTGSPIIHRARFAVNESENWYSKVDTSLVSAKNCAELEFCPAPYDGFITKGDDNAYYDQTENIAPPVKSEWIRGKAVVKVPWLGYVRLLASGS